MATDTNNKTETLYTLYILTCIANNKRYIGITDKDPQLRWKGGDGYRTNFELYTDIRKYGWEEGCKHEIVSTNLTLEEAKEAEKVFVKTYDTQNQEKGYNHRGGGICYGGNRPRGSIGEKLKLLRKNKHYTQEKVAEDLGLVRATISNYEVGRRVPSMPDLQLFAQYYGVDFGYFGVSATDPDFELNTRIIEYFKNEAISIEEKIALFNDIILAYTKYIIEDEE